MNDYQATMLKVAQESLTYWRERKKEILLCIGDVLCGDSYQDINELYGARDCCIANIIRAEQEIKFYSKKEVVA